MYSRGSNKSLPVIQDKGVSNFYSVSLGKSPDNQTHLLRQVRTHPGQVKFESYFPNEQAEIQEFFFRALGLLIY